MQKSYSIHCYFSLSDVKSEWSFTTGIWGTGWSLFRFVPGTVEDEDDFFSSDGTRTGLSSAEPWLNFEMFRVMMNFEIFASWTYHLGRFQILGNALIVIR